MPSISSKKEVRKDKLSTNMVLFMYKKKERKKKFVTSEKHFCNNLLIYMK